MARAVPSLSSTEVRILSELVRCRKGTSPTDLARRAELPRPTLYVLLSRLARRKCVSRRRVPVRGRPEYCVIYAINDRGREARALFAQKVGLKP